MLLFHKRSVFLFALALLLVLTIFGWLRWRNGSIVALGPQQTVYTVNPKLGVHTRLTDEVEPWKIKQTLEMVRQMGSPWIVEYFPWAYIEAKPGQYQWDHADLVIDHATRQGLMVIARLGYTPEWARPKETSPLYLEPAHFADFSHFAAAFAKRYQGRVHYLILLNEPNLALEWGYQPPDPAKYVALLRSAYPLIKAVNPEVQILAGALAPTFDSEWGIDDRRFLRSMYELGAADFFDILAVHAYGWSLDPDDPAAPEVINFRRTELLRQIMVEYGDQATPVMITEGGWNDHPRWTRAVRPAQRITYTLRAYEIAQNEWPWLQAMALWVFRYPWDAKSYQDYFTFVRTDFEAKPIYLEVQRYAQGAQ